MRVKVLRIGHRKKRDVRLTTHVCLSARALGADEAILSGEEDKPIMDSVIDVVERWGGSFKVSYEKNWRGVIKSHQKRNFAVVHLTMYGEPIQDKIQEIKSINKDILIVVGSEKVPGEVYDLADYNIAVTNQPHSEVAALAIFLDMLFDGKELEKKQRNAKLEIKPQKKGKKVVKKRGFFDFFRKR